MDVDPVQLISDGLSAVTEGCRLPVKMAGPGDDWPMAEVCYIRIYFLLILHVFLFLGMNLSLWPKTWDIEYMNTLSSAAEL